MAPVRVGVAVVGMNLVLNAALIWPLAEAGLAVATALSAAVQASVLSLLFSRGKSRLDWPVLGATTLRTALATAVMAAAGYGVLRAIRPAEGLPGELARVLVPLVVSVAVFLVTHRLAGGRELRILVSGISHEE